MPSAVEDIELRAGPTPEKTPLLLPSALPPSTELTSIRLKEARLRVAQADDSLVELRRLLRITAGLTEYKHTQVGYGQAPNTRARSQISRFKDKVTLAAQRYRAAHQALLALDPQGPWITRLHHLDDSHIRWPSKNPDEGEGTREISWIWRSHPTVSQVPRDVPCNSGSREGDSSANDETIDDTHGGALLRPPSPINEEESDIGPPNPEIGEGQLSVSSFVSVC